MCFTVYVKEPSTDPNGRYDVWYEDTDGEVGVLGSGSDYTAFLHKGMASVSLTENMIC